MTNKLKVLYEDNHIIVVEKPPNVLSQGDSTKDIDLLTMVKEYIKEKYNKPGNVYIGLVHRLDRPTSGVMVFARNSKSAKRLTDEIKQKKMKKKYLAVVDGIIKKDSDTLIDYLERDDFGNTKISNVEHGKYAELDYKVLKRNYKKNLTLVEVDLKTGRHHQIRVQFASRLYPLCGDKRYGKASNSQLALCAYSLTLIHPITKEEMTFKVPIPEGKYWDYFN